MTDQEIADVYYTPGAAGSFQRPVKLYQSLRKKGVNITLTDVTKWLNRQDVYTMNRIAHHKFDKGTIIANSLMQQSMYSPTHPTAGQPGGYHGGYLGVCCLFKPPQVLSPDWNLGICPN